MNTVKFRAWDKKYNEMLDDGFVLFNGMIYRDTRDFEDGRNTIDIELMQFTGLHDKNGVEIYEGDIVSIIDCEPSLYKIVYWNNNFKWGVEYTGSDITNWQEESLEEFDSECFEVIGNIYEHGDLLK